MKTKKILNYSTEFKTRIVLELLQTKATMKDISQKYALSLSTLSLWKKTVLQNASTIFAAKERIKNYNATYEKEQRKQEKLVQQLAYIKHERDNAIMKYRHDIFEKELSKKRIFCAQEQYEDHFLHYLLIS